jgi:hypothetical protein
MNNRRPEPHTLAGAYAMDALTGADQAQFERHLARCPECVTALLPAPSQRPRIVRPRHCRRVFPCACDGCSLLGAVAAPWVRLAALGVPSHAFEYCAWAFTTVYWCS